MIPDGTSKRSAWERDEDAIVLALADLPAEYSAAELLLRGRLIMPGNVYKRRHRLADGQPEPTKVEAAQIEETLDSVIASLEERLAAMKAFRN